MWYRHRHGRGRKIAALMVMMLGASTLVACNHSPEAKIDKISDRIASKLDFNDGQKALLSDITSELKKDVAEARTHREEKFADFEKILMANTLDKEAIKAHIKERQQARDAKIDKYLEKVAALHATLNSEQKKEMLEKIHKFKKHWL